MLCKRPLREAVTLAHAAYKRAAELFKALAREAPSGPPHPGGALRVANAAKQEQLALDEYVKAMRAFNDYAVARRHPQG